MEKSMHLDETCLRAFLDNELAAPAQSTASAHLAQCSTCRDQLRELEQQAGLVRAALQSLAPASLVAQRSNSLAAWKKFENQIQEKKSMSKTLVRFRPVWALLTLSIVLVVALSFPSVQALASNFLRLFRVQQVAVLPLDMTSLKDTRFDPTLGQTLSQVLSQQVKITRQPGKPVKVTDAAQATQMAGFQVRLNQNPPLALSKLTVQSGMAFEGTFDQALAEQVLQTLGKSDLTLPAGLNGAVIKANIPDAVIAAYGQCRYTAETDKSGATGGPSLGIGDNCLLLVQLPSPTVDTPPDLPVQRLAELGLQVLGSSPAKAAQIAAQIDWTTTLVIPIPQGEMNSQTVAVDQVSGTLLTQDKTSNGAKNTYTLVWVKNGIVYGLLGSGDPARGLALANDLK